jgi:hypothetical protein
MLCLDRWKRSQIISVGRTSVVYLGALSRVPPAREGVLSISGQDRHRPPAPLGWADIYQGPKTRSPVAEIAAHSRSRSAPIVSASDRTVSGIRYDALGRPRYGIGVR